MNKDKLRQEFLRKRQGFIPFKKKADQKIFQKFINLPIVKKAKTICFYVSKKGEVDTHQLIKYFLGKSHCHCEERSDEAILLTYKIASLSLAMTKQIIVPKVVGKNLELYKIKSLSDLAPGAFGIPEPKVLSPKFLVLSSHVDLFVTPGLVFSKSGQRLGFGKGYYDRLLKNTRAFKLGLAYSWQIVEKIPEGKGDVLMDMVLTEKSK